MRRIPRAVALLGLLLAAAAIVAVSLGVGSEPLSRVTRTIVLEYRLPRSLLAFLVGASLAASGVCFQGLFRNALADPFLIGVSGGSALGAVSSIVLGVELTFLGLGSATVAAFAGGVGAAFLAYQIARVRGRVRMEGLLLAGSAIGAFAGALVSVLLLYSTRNWNEVISWLMGNLGQPDPWYRVKVVAPCLLVSASVMILHARELNLLLLGEESAAQLGVEAERVKRLLLAAGSVAAAGAVATCGMIGFVGLIVPHMVRRLVGSDHRTLLPVTVVAGSAALALADVVSRAVSPGSPLPIGAVTAIGGAPFFVYLLRRKPS
jgi:iron complex transport system permease protein